MAVGTSDKGEIGEERGGEPEEEDGGGMGQTAACEAMREMVLVAEVEGFMEAPADPEDGEEIGEDDAEDEDWLEDGESMGMGIGVEVGEDGEDGEQIADEMTAGVAEED